MVAAVVVGILVGAAAVVVVQILLALGVTVKFWIGKQRH